MASTIKAYASPPKKDGTRCPERLASANMPHPSQMLYWKIICDSVKVKFGIKVKHRFKVWSTGKLLVKFSKCHLTFARLRLRIFQYNPNIDHKVNDNYKSWHVCIAYRCHTGMIIVRMNAYSLSTLYEHVTWTYVFSIYSMCKIEYQGMCYNSFKYRIGHMACFLLAAWTWIIPSSSSPICRTIWEEKNRYCVLQTSHHTHKSKH